MSSETTGEHYPDAAVGASMAGRTGVPPEITDLSDMGRQDSFFLRGGLVNAWFIRRSDILLVTFDNLMSLTEHDPPQPWLQGRAAAGGFSILGVMASRKDWYRNEDTPRLIVRLRDAGFFDGFRRVVFVGASMGGFAALAYSILVPGSVVLAFSPQSSLARSIVPFEKRYRFAARKWDWQTPGFLDAAEGAAAAAEVYLVYDPFVPEDAAHARRLVGPRVQHLPVPHTGHRAIRMIKDIGGLQELIEDAARGTLDRRHLAIRLRRRRDNHNWQRALLSEAERRGHVHLTLKAAEFLLRREPSHPFARRMARRLRARIAPVPPGSLPAPVPEDRTVLVTAPPARAPFRGEIAFLSNALVVPERKTGPALSCGVLDSSRTWCELSRGWIRAQKPYQPATVEATEPVEKLSGTHLYAGHFRGHFGHFLVEATARLWALGHLESPPDSILYLPFRGNAVAMGSAIRSLAPFFRLLDIDLPVQTSASILEVERLIVPELGFGWGARYAGSPAYRAFMQGRLNRAASADGPEDLYISRSRLNAQRGGILGESVIEQNLARLGYEVFHPERHPLEVQVARYKAARRIIALDGSALHLAAYLLAPGSRVAMIKRRSAANVADYLLQFRSFCNVEIDVIDVVQTDWVTSGAERSDYRSVGELDFASLFTRLASLGYVPAEFRPDLPDQAGMDTLRGALQDKRSDPFVPLVRASA